jgi:hypothetical protein
MRQEMTTDITAGKFVLTPGGAASIISRTWDLGCGESLPRSLPPTTLCAPRGVRHLRALGCRMQAQVRGDGSRFAPEAQFAGDGIRCGSLGCAAGSTHSRHDWQ